MTGLTMETREFSQSEWHAIVSQFEDLNLIQLWEYGETKRQLQGWTVVRHIWRTGDVIVGAAQAMVKTIPLTRKGFVWINRAPLWRKNNNDSLSILQDMMKTLVRYWAEERGMYFRIAPTLELREEYPALMRDMGLDEISNSHWASAKIDLTKSIDEIRSGLDKKWRNCLAKAEKSGLTYSMATDEVHLAELVYDYKALLSRKEFSSVTPEFISLLQQLLPADRKMWVLCGRRGEKKLGSILIARYGDTAEYLVGAVGPEGRAENAGQFLLWNAIIEMKRAGLRCFDLGGMHPEKTPKGILHFKQGVGGIPYQLIGEFGIARNIIARGIKTMIKYRS